MIFIIFFCNWGLNSHQLLERYKLITKNDSGILNNIQGTTDINKAQYIIFIEGIPNNFNLKLLNNKKLYVFHENQLVKRIGNY